MARRGFFAELQHQSRLAARESARAERAAVRNHMAALRLAEQARKADQRMQAELARANAAEQKRLQKQALEAHVAAQEAEVDEKNTKLESDYAEIDSILVATLDVDDFIDLNQLRVVVRHPVFAKPELEVPAPLPTELPFPAEPVLGSPPRPKGLMAFLCKKKHALALAKANDDYKNAIEAHQQKKHEILALRQDARLAHSSAESVRIAQLNAARAQYARECEAREIEASERNKRLDELIANLSYGVADAVQEYVSIVLANSVYPECFPVSHEFSFDPTVAELKLKVLVPGPDKISTLKAYKYSKAADEISHTALPQKACRERYGGAVHQVALRSLHEVFECDRRGIIKTISLTVGTNTVSPATGQLTYVPFVVVAAQRDKFLAFNLAAVVPAYTLEHLGAAVSKNPYALESVDSQGVRRA
jgi:restriction system protein